MTTYTAQCEIDSTDTVTAARSSGRIELESHGSREVYLDPAPARKFARGIIALADEIDGGEAKEGTAEPTLKPGDKIRILVDDAEFADVKQGDVLTVHEITTTTVTVDDEVNGGFWYFRNEASWEKVVDEPAEPLADWERELLEGPTPTVRSSRARFVEEATSLLADKPAGVDQILRLAEWLSAGE